MLPQDPPLGESCVPASEVGGAGAWLTGEAACPPDRGAHQSGMYGRPSSRYGVLGGAGARSGREVWARWSSMAGRLPSRCGEAGCRCGHASCVRVQQEEHTSCGPRAVVLEQDATMK